jgi:ATP-dependent helicase HrpA
MNEEDILTAVPDESEIAKYPDSVCGKGWKLECNYRFLPGRPEDGVTLKIPVQSVPAVPADSLDWAVPGLLQEKIAALLRSLPKEYRKKLMPLATTTGIVLAEMPREGRLLSTLNRFLYSRFGVDIPADSWRITQLDERLNLRFSVVDAKGRELAAGRDLSILEKGFDDEDGSRAYARACTKHERSGITSWDIGDIEESILIEEPGVSPFHLYPALAVDGENASLRLFRSAREAVNAHREGVKILFIIHFRNDLRQLRKTLSPTGEMKVWAAAFGGVKALENALFDKVAEDLFAIDIRCKSDFFSLAETLRSRILPKGQDILQSAAPVLKGIYDVAEKFRLLEASNRFNRPFLAFLDDLRGELAALVPPDFLISHGSERLAHIVRYLRALAIRAEKGAVHLEKAISRAVEIGELAALVKELTDAGPPHSDEKRSALEGLRWTIEEYKVSVFAQELKTPFPVSRKRIDSRMEEIRRMV